MKHQYRSGTEWEAASIAMAQIKTLVVSLSRVVELLDSEIETEEERTRCKDFREPAYSILAGSLTARRDNLLVTIAALQERLMAMERLTTTEPVNAGLLPA